MEPMKNKGRLLSKKNLRKRLIRCEGFILKNPLARGSLGAEPRVWTLSQIPYENNIPRCSVAGLLILRLGYFLNTGFSQIFLMLNPLNREVGEVFDTYIYRVGIREGYRLSYTTAVGLFKSVVGLALVLISDRIAKKTDNEGIL
jgi:hypothetical protein